VKATFVRHLAALLFVASCLVLAACDGQSAISSDPTPTGVPAPAASITIAAGQPITIGISAALSGDQVNLGTDIADAADLAAADFGGSLKSHPIVIKRLDDGCTDAEKAVAVADELIADATLVGVIGPMCTTGSQAASDEYENAGIVHISPSATRVDLSEKGERYFFRTSWRDDVQARLQASHATGALQARSAIVIDDGDPYGKGLADAFASRFTESGGQVLVRERIARGDVDFVPLAREIVAAAPDIVVFEGLNPEGALIVKALRDGQFTGAFMAPDGVLNTRDFLQAAGAATEGAIVTGGPTPDDAFTARFNERFQRMPSTPFVLQSHDAVTMLLRAIDSVAQSSNGGLTIDRTALLSELRQMQFDGLTGHITFDERGDRRGERAPDVGLRIYRVREGRFEPIE
jgi:branched-chain amino acid transport system substrate-binding protein